MTNQLNPSQELSSTIEIMRFPLIFLVVIVHMVAFDTPKIELDFSDKNSIYTFITEMISHNLGRIAVPCYFFISGYFSFKHFSKFSFHNYFKNIRKRFWTIMLPYFIWNSLMIMAICLKSELFEKLGFGSDENYLFIQETTAYDWFWGIPINFPLWYMRDLIVMVLFSPIFYFWFRFLRFYGVIPLVIIYLFVVESNIPGFSTTAVTFFGLGAMFSILNKDFLEFCIRIKLISIIAFFFLLMLATLYNGTSYHEYIVRMFILCGVFAVFNIFYILSKFDKIKMWSIRFSAYSFFIYVVHEIFVINWLKGGWSRLSFNNTFHGKLAGYFLIPVICIIVCILVFELWKKVSPRSLAYFTGGRMTSY